MSASLLRVAFVGAGQMACHHLNVVARQHAVVVGVHDRAADQAREFAAAVGTAIFSSIDSLIAGARLDIVHVCTPPGAHFDAAEAALDGGAAGRPFGVVMLDVIVPGDIGGKEAVSQLTDIDPAVKAILVSGYAQDSVLAEFRDYGFQAVITKPFTLQELGTTLDSVIGSSGWRVH